VLLVPRPSHSKKDPAAAQAFREELADKLEKQRHPTATSRFFEPELEGAAGWALTLGK
jgi:hypothetical protein